ncbi:PD-(D/E)XK nuclease family protein [Phocaeicola oris]|uniref:PD-(D/E)XK nuclease family protein n=1 Tax=Phocaeicola oris TaxID=2896850 RepID=UPI00234F2537|nr:PD-(D/E)XK nuclease family protein [Phocaeicola oris]MCE2617581.1 PD-(D/E)XK nuclease family protein [Phocaeicola oris]
METFLKQVATDLYKRTKGNLAHTAVIFPNKRASLFFNEYLAKQSDNPIWSPTYLSISELFQSMSKLKLCDRIELVCILYKVYKEVTGSDETLDDFYFWGELMISDFDDVDKNLVDAKRLFANIEDLANLTTDYSYLSEEQIDAINKFFKDFSIEKETILKKQFKAIWNSLNAIYEEFNKALKEDGLAYEGMLYREVMNKLQTEKYDHYIFIGFNVLNKVEHQLFETFYQSGKAIFYWDYDTYYVPKDKKGNHLFHEAGQFLNQNLRDFPNALPIELFNNLSKPKEIEYIASPTENAQTRYLPDWLERNLTENEKETAVVLCNEALLQPVLHSLPDKLKHINITMGFPLSQTPIYSFVNALMNLYITGYDDITNRYTYQTVVSILKHPYTQLLSKDTAEKLIYTLTKNNRFFPSMEDLLKDDFLNMLFTPINKNNIELCSRLNEILQKVTEIYKEKPSSNEMTAQEKAFNQLYRESLFKVYTTINRFHTLIDNNELIIKPQTLTKLISRVLFSMNIPFHGEPAIGLQVMGVLETRNLDFKHLILLSVNEGQLPKSEGDSSFIPYNIRKAFGMTTIEHQMAVYAYYFYRMIQRAEKITLIYNTFCEGLNKGEWSRFMLQFLLESNQNIKRYYLKSEQSPQPVEEITIEKNANINEILRNKFDMNRNTQAYLSPTALNSYIECKLKFYYQYIAGLKPLDEVTADIDSPTFGNIFHKTAETIYNDLSSRDSLITKERLKTLLKDEIKLQQYVDNSFKTEFFKIDLKEKSEYNGLQLINYKVILEYIKQLLRLDSRYTPFRYIGAEKKVFGEYDILIPQTNEIIKVHIGGTIDRMDMKDNTLRIVDYKTGRHNSTVSSIESIFKEDRKDGSNYIFQIFLYSDIITQQQNSMIKPALLYIQKAASSDYTPDISIGTYKNKLTVEDYNDYKEEFRANFTAFLQEIFSPEGKFTQTNEENNCKYCNFKALCKKENLKN